MRGFMNPRIGGFANAKKEDNGGANPASGRLATTTGAQVWPSRLYSARNASPSNSGVASKDGLLSVQICRI